MRPFDPALDWTAHEEAALASLLSLALAEDVRSGDLTTLALVPEDATGAAALVARQSGVVAGVPAALAAFRAVDARIECEVRLPDGSPVRPGDSIAVVRGPARGLLTGERTALNFLGRLSGVATLTRAFADAIQGTRAGVYDTRKTTPGWRLLEKYAVRAGGGRNHRVGLYDGVIIKDNHLAFGAAGRPGEKFSPAEAVRAARERCPAGTFVEVEVDSLAQLDEVLPASPDAVLLDNMSLDQLRQAVAKRDSVAPGVALEASGNVKLSTIAAIAATGVERISSGALTHSAPNFDVGLDWT